MREITMQDVRLIAGEGELDASTVLAACNALVREWDRSKPVFAKYPIGMRVTKRSGSSWTGLVCGFYSTALTPIGYAVESENEPGSVKIYPEAALKGFA